VMRARAAIPGTAAEGMRLVVGARAPLASPWSGVLQVRGALPGGQLSWRLEGRPWGALDERGRETSGAGGGPRFGQQKLTIKGRCVVGRLLPVAVRLALDVYPEDGGAGRAGARLRVKLKQSSAATFLPERRGLGHTSLTAAGSVATKEDGGTVNDGSGVAVSVAHTAGVGARRSVWLHTAFQARLPGGWPVSAKDGGALRVDLTRWLHRAPPWSSPSSRSSSLGSGRLPEIKLKKVGVAYLPSRVDATRWILPILPYYATSKATLAVVNSGCKTVSLGSMPHHLHMPVARERSRVSSAFGPRVHPVHGAHSHHNGIDYADHLGSPIYAAEGGIVTHSGPAGGFGNLVEVQHGRGLTSLYGHLHKCLVPHGAMVRRDQLLGLMGTTGNSTGVHLHFELRNAANKPVNPAPLLR